MSSLRGRLLLAGLSNIEAEQALAEIQSSQGNGPLSEQEIYVAAKNWLSSNRLSAAPEFEKLIAYDEARETTGQAPLIVAIEGASATGKTMLALEVLKILNATRFLSTDTVRQVLRSMMSESTHPELHCHTYQAHQFRQEGPETLEPVVRGFIAQSSIIMPRVMDLTSRVLAEGAIAVVEGVHILPGALADLGPSVLEILVSPSRDTHEAMFLAKHTAGKLKSVSDDRGRRNQEFHATLRIQEYLLEQAREKKVHVVRLQDYEQALGDIFSLILKCIEALI